MKTPNRSITLLVLIGLVVTQSGEAQRTRTEPSLGDRGTAVGATLSTVADAIPATIVSTAKTTTTVTLNWSAVPGASGYTVSRVQNPTGSDRYYPLMATPLAANNVSYTDASVLPGMTYGYTVTAVRPDGHYGTSTPVSVTTLPPVNPTGFTATAGYLAR